MSFYKFVYFMKPVGMDGPIKIGCTIDIGERLNQLARWSPFPLELVAHVEGGPRLERKLHSYFREHHSHKEWFSPSPMLLALIAHINGGGAIEDLIDIERVKILRSGTLVSRHDDAMRILNVKRHELRPDILEDFAR